MCHFVGTQLLGLQVLVLAVGIQTSQEFIQGLLRSSPGFSPLSLEHKTLTVSFVSLNKMSKRFILINVFYLGAKGSPPILGPVGE